MNIFFFSPCVMNMNNDNERTLRFHRICLFGQRNYNPNNNLPITYAQQESDWISRHHYPSLHLLFCCCSCRVAIWFDGQKIRSLYSVNLKPPVALCPSKSSSPIKMCNWYPIIRSAVRYSKGRIGFILIEIHIEKEYFLLNSWILLVERMWFAIKDFFLSDSSWWLDRQTRFVDYNKNPLKLTAT